MEFKAAPSLTEQFADLLELNAGYFNSLVFFLW